MEPLTILFKHEKKQVCMHEDGFHEDPEDHKYLHLTTEKYKRL